MVPLAYAQLQVLEQAIKATGSLNDDVLAGYCRTNDFETVTGTISFGDGGEWKKSRVVQVQFQNITNNEVETFRDSSVQVVVSPSEYVSGDFIYPF